MAQILSNQAQTITMNKCLLILLTALSLQLFSFSNLSAVTTTWTGNTDSNWATATNWDTNAVPTVEDDVVIPDTTTDPEIQTGTDAVAKSVLIKTGGRLTIDLGSNLNIDGSTGIAFRNQGDVSNSGILRIGANASISGAGIWNQAVFTNEVDGEIFIDQIFSYGVWNFSSSNIDVVTFTNSGKLTIGANGTIGQFGIFNYTNSIFTNTTSGEISIDQTNFPGINNYSTFANSGKITIGANKLINSSGIQNNGIFINEINGEIFIEKVKYYAIFNGASDATFTNLGKITVGTINAGTLGIANIGTFINEVGGEISIDRTSDFGILNNKIFTNSGIIVIGGNAPAGNSGLTNSGNLATFDNQLNGEIFIDQTSINGISNSAPFFNSGKIIMGGNAEIGVYGIDNGSAFTNEAGGEIYVDKAISALRHNSPEPFINNACATIYFGERIISFGIFQNEGFLLSDSETDHIILDASFTNTGTIQDVYGAFEGLTFDNQDLIIPSISNCIDNIFPDALQIGTDNSFTVGSDWYTDEKLTTDAGNYNQGTNIFTLDIPTGDHTLYMEVTDNDNACTQVMAIQLKTNTPPTVSIEINELCPGDDLDLTETGEGEIQWNWSGPNNFTSYEQNPTLSAPTTENNGDYTVIVTSENGCTASSTLAVEIPEEFSFDVDDATQTQTGSGMNVYAVELCGGVFPFNVDLDATGGFASSSLSPSANAGCQNLQITYANGVEWTATIADANDCSNESSLISSDDLGGTALLMIDGFDVVKETGINKLDGELTVNVSGGDDSCSDYTYDWSGPNTTTSNTGSTTGNTLTGLGSGSYSVTVTDCDGNTVVGSQYLNRAVSRRGRGRKTALNTSISSKLQLYPNPATDFVQIAYDMTKQTGETTISIADLAGRNLWTQIIEEKEGRLELPLSDFNSGLYIVTMKVDNELIGKEKLLIMK